MKVAIVVALAVGSGAAGAQSLHFSLEDSDVPYVRLDGSALGRLRTARIDVLRCPLDWKRYTNAQLGMQGCLYDPLYSPDWWHEQLIAVNLGSSMAPALEPLVEKVIDRGDRWDVYIKVDSMAGAFGDAPQLFSPYVVVKTPYGPDDYRFIIDSPSGRDVIDLFSRRDRYVPIDWRPRR